MGAGTHADEKQPNDVPLILQRQLYPSRQFQKETVPQGKQVVQTQAINLQDHMTPAVMLCRCLSLTKDRTKVPSEGEDQRTGVHYSLAPYKCALCDCVNEQAFVSCLVKWDKGNISDCYY